MADRMVAATQLGADCIRLIEEASRDGDTIVVTRDGRPVARLVPVEGAVPRPPLVGSMKGTVLHYDDPFSPAIAPNEWHAVG